MSSEGLGRRGICLAAAVLILGGVVGCQKPTVGNLGEPVQEKGAPVAVTVVGYSLERVEIEGEKGPLVFPEPVLAVTLKMENKGQAAHPYQPTHTADKATNLQSPLLFVDPGPKAPPSLNITGVYLEEGRLPSQKTGLIQIAPGESVEDTFLFQPPTEENVDLMMTIPPAIHGGKNFLHVRISYTRPEAPGVTVHEPGKDIVVGDVTVKVTPGAVEYVKLKDVNKGEGFSKDPVYKVAFTLSNKGEKPVQYDPGHLQVGEALGVTLTENGGAGRFLRVRFGGDREVPGQIRSATVIEPGKSVTDFAIFEQPSKQVKSLRLSIPARLFAGEGLLRIDMPYTYSEPEKPKQ